MEKKVIKSLCLMLASLLLIVSYFAHDCLGWLDNLIIRVAFVLAISVTLALPFRYVEGCNEQKRLIWHSGSFSSYVIV